MSDFDLHFILAIVLLETTCFPLLFLNFSSFSFSLFSFLLLFLPVGRDINAVAANGVVDELIVERIEFREAALNDVVAVEVFYQLHYSRTA